MCQEPLREDVAEWSYLRNGSYDLVYRLRESSFNKDVMASCAKQFGRKIIQSLCAIDATQRSIISIVVRPLEMSCRDLTIVCQKMSVQK